MEFNITSLTQAMLPIIFSLHTWQYKLRTPFSTATASLLSQTG